MNYSVGDKFLITCDNWFLAPDGKQYKAVHGTINAILNDSEALGIATNRHSANWFVSIGNMVIAGCQIHYAIKTDDCRLGNVVSENLIENELKRDRRESMIYNADE